MKYRIGLILLASSSTGPIRLGQQWLMRSVVVAVLLVAASGCATNTSTALGARSLRTQEEAGSGHSVASASAVAMDVYLADFDARTEAAKNPARADVGWIISYEAGNARAATERAFAYMKTHHLAYRGEPPHVNAQVETTRSAAVVLTSCLLTSKNNPWVEYDTTTGKVLPATRRYDAFFSHRMTIVMAEMNAEWDIVSIRSTSDTCS